MKKYLNFMFLAVITLAIASCANEEPRLNNDEENDSIPATGPGSGSGSGNSEVLLMTVMEMVGENTITFEYDSKNRLTRNVHSAGTIIEYKYNGNGHVSTILAKEMNGRISLREDFTYGKDGKPISKVATVYNKEENYIVDSKYVFSDNKLVVTNIPRTDEEEKYITTEEYVYNKKNLTSLSFGLNGKIHSVFTMSEHDNNPSAGLYGGALHWIPSNNNVLREQLVSPAGNHDYTFKYTYNKQGYPTKQLKYNTGSDVVVGQTNYSYRPAN